MKSVFVVITGILLLAGQVFGAEDTTLTSQRDKVSYTIGVYSGNNLKQQSVDIDPDIMVKGIKDSLSGGKTLLTDQEMQEVMAVFQKDMTAKQAEKRNALAEKNMKEGEAFLAENKKRKGLRPCQVVYSIRSSRQVRVRTRRQRMEWSPTTAAPGSMEPNLTVHTSGMNRQLSS